LSRKDNKIHENERRGRDAGGRSEQQWKKKMNLGPGTRDNRFRNKRRRREEMKEGETVEEQ